MARESVLLNEIGLEFKELVKSKAFLIEPKTIRYDNIQIVLLVKDSKEEEYEMFLWLNEKVKKEISFKNSNNIYSGYNSLYNVAKRILDNKLKN